MSSEPGFLRFVGTGEAILPGTELQIEVQQRDGTWIPFRGVCAATINIRADHFVTATLEVEIGALDLTGVQLDATIVRDSRSRWQRFLALVRGQ